MKKNILYSIALLAISSVAMTGCSDDPRYDIGAEGEGRVFIRTSINSDVKVVSRAPEENAELAAKTTIWISNAKGLIREYKSIDDVPANGVSLLVGSYVAEAWAGDSVPASFTDRWFKGRQEFAIEKNGRTQVTIECKIANTVAQVSFDDAVTEVLDVYKLEVGTKAGTLDFDASTEAEAKGYFMMPSFDPDLHYTLTGTRKADGQAFTLSGVITKAKPATLYKLHVRHDGQIDSPLGGGMFTVVVEESPVEVEDSFDITAAPVISGISFDITKPVIGQEGAVGRRSIWVAASSYLEEVEVSCPEFGAILGISGNDFELYHMQPDVKAALDAMEVTWTETRHEDTGMQELKLNLSAQLLNKLPKGDHSIVIRCLDADNRESTATVRVVISDALVETVETPADAPTTWATTAVIKGRVMKDNATNPGIAYRATGAGVQPWQKAYPEARAGYQSGDEYSVNLTGLTPGTTYEYRSIADDFEAGTTATFTTESALQLPNSGFEDWFIEEGVQTLLGKKNVQRIGTDKASLFWDSGNEGAATGNATLTMPDSEIKHGGSYSAKLASKAVVGKFAAGNLFIGQYLKTDGTDGVLGWGRAWNVRPKALRVWVRYQGGTVDKVDKNDTGSGLKIGDRDEGKIYIALCDNSKQSYNNTSWPCVVKTKPADRSLFTKDDANVLAYGEHVFTSDTEGDGLVMVEIPIDYKRTDLRPSNIIMVAAASRGGDYFTGSTKSVMWLDDLELVY